MQQDIGLPNDVIQVTISYLKCNLLYCVVGNDIVRLINWFKKKSIFSGKTKHIPKYKSSGKLNWLKDKDCVLEMTRLCHVFIVNNILAICVM